MANKLRPLWNAFLAAAAVALLFGGMSMSCSAGQLSGYRCIDLGSNFAPWEILNNGAIIGGIVNGSDVDDDSILSVGELYHNKLTILAEKTDHSTFFVCNGRGTVAAEQAGDRCLYPVIWLAGRRIMPLRNRFCVTAIDDDNNVYLIDEVGKGNATEWISRGSGGFYRRLPLAIAFAAYRKTIAGATQLNGYDMYDLIIERMGGPFGRIAIVNPEGKAQKLLCGRWGTPLCLSPSGWLGGCLPAAIGTNSRRTRCEAFLAHGDSLLVSHVKEAYWSAVVSVNDGGEAVGIYTTGLDERGYPKPEMGCIFSPTPNGLSATNLTIKGWDDDCEATSINDAGCIVGRGSYDNQGHGFLLVPLDRPQ